MSTKPKAIVSLSGGQDSTTVVLEAIAAGYEVHAISISYGQRHAVEMISAKQVSEYLGIANHEFIRIPSGILVSTSPLVSSNELGQYQNENELPGGIEPTFIPQRNTLFLTLAANRAQAIGAKAIYLGVCEEDFGGYPDCRRAFIDSMQESLGRASTGNPREFQIITPLMQQTKMATVLRGMELCNRLGVDFDELFAMTHTCYAGVTGGCGKCHACILRDRGFRDAGIPDPLWAIRQSAA